MNNSRIGGRHNAIRVGNRNTIKKRRNEARDKLRVLHSILSQYDDMKLPLKTMDQIDTTVKHKDLSKLLRNYMNIFNDNMDVLDHNDISHIRSSLHDIDHPHDQSDSASVTIPSFNNRNGIDPNPISAAENDVKDYDLGLRLAKMDSERAKLMEHMTFEEKQKVLIDNPDYDNELQVVDTSRSFVKMLQSAEANRVFRSNRFNTRTNRPINYRRHAHR